MNNDNNNITKEIITISKDLDIKMEIITEFIPVEKGLSLKCGMRLLPNKYIKYNDKGEIVPVEKP